MTATTTFAAPPTTVPEGSLAASTRPRVLRTGVAAGVAASIATVAFAAMARGIDVPLAVGGKSIPMLGFAQVTFFFSLVGTGIAAAVARRATHPHHTFLVTTLALTLVSFVPDITADAHTATKLALALSHVVAAAILIPALASRLSD
jgi:hypothetical protein